MQRTVIDIYGKSYPFTMLGNCQDIRNISGYEEKVVNVSKHLKHDPILTN